MPATEFRSLLNRLGFPPALVLALAAVWLTALPSAAQADPADRSTDGLQRLVDGLRARLHIPHRVTVAVVTSNPKLVSVTRADAEGRPFRLAIEAAFLATLTDDELSAALAHELGHVWVFTHHPFLQTERLANDVAMRAVSRDSLEQLYDKMWARLGRAGDVAVLLGPRDDVAALAVTERAPGRDARRTDYVVD